MRRDCLGGGVSAFFGQVALAVLGGIADNDDPLPMFFAVSERVGLVAHCYTGSDASKYQRGSPHGMSVLIWEDGTDKELDGTSSIEGDRFANCEEAFTLRGTTDLFLSILPKRDQALAGKTYELFPCGQRIYTVQDLLTFPN